MSETPAYQDARNLAIDQLRRTTSHTSEEVRQVAEKVSALMPVLHPEEPPLDVAALISELLHLFSVTVENATILDDHDPDAHVPWLGNKRSSISFRFWDRYQTYLERDLAMPPASVLALHEVTDSLLERLEDPSRPGPWSRRGMVVGSVQSGKTANYVGLMCKAIDAGYKLVVVLAGLHDDLRAQTQLRIDEGLIGFDTKAVRRLETEENWIGVGKMPGPRLVVNALTSSSENGDFHKQVARAMNVQPGDRPIILAVKKNAYVLKNLIEWLKPAMEAGRTDVPLLLIDDEADNASVNTREDPDAPGVAENVTAINGRIRELLDSFERSAYVGYTATPFANVFINPEAEAPGFGKDLFPASFIVNLKPPSNHVGPARVFGMDGDPDAGILGQNGLPIVREIADAESIFPPKHGRDLRPTELPPSLERAIRSFILVCAARRARGQLAKHNSMLVHVTRFVDVQWQVKTLIEEKYLLPMVDRLRYGDGRRTPTLRDELREFWLTDFQPTSASIETAAGAASLTWESVAAHLSDAASAITVVALNGEAKETLDYKENEATGRLVIAVGGDKLSRGLTLEGLSVSYFLRHTRMYDTLMQMGRWFGYRPGYLDLCRLFTTRRLVDWYRHIALADTELRREFDYMVDAGLTPIDYGLRVRAHPGGMLVTALNKMSFAARRQISWNGVLKQTWEVPLDPQRSAHNLERTESLLRQLGQPVSAQVPGQAGYRWVGVSAEAVASFVGSLRMPPQSANACGEVVATFIRRQATKEYPELTDWTVVLLSVKTTRARRLLGGHDVGLTRRSPAKPLSTSAILRNANVISPKHQAIDLSFMEATESALAEFCAKADDDTEVVERCEEEVALFRREQPGPAQSLHDFALFLTRHRIRSGLLDGAKDTDVPNGRVVREVRPRQNGLLLVYPLRIATDDSDDDLQTEPARIAIALSFPTSHTVKEIEYDVNRIWLNRMEDELADED